MRSHGVLVNGPSPTDIATADEAVNALEEELAVVVEPELPEVARGVALDADAHLRPGGRQAAFAVVEAERVGATHLAAGIRQAQDLLQALTDKLAAQDARYGSRNQRAFTSHSAYCRSRPPELRRKLQPILLLEWLPSNC